MNIDFYKKYLQEAKDFRFELYTNFARSNHIDDAEKATFVAMYLLYQAHKYNCLDLSIEETFDKLYSILNEHFSAKNNPIIYSDCYNFIAKLKVLTSECLSENAWPHLKTVSKQYSINAIRTSTLLFDYTKFKDGRLIVPASVNRLVSRILDVDTKEELLNIYSGIGNYLVYENAVNEKINFIGVEPDENACLLAAMKSTVLDKYIKLYDYSPFQLLESAKDQKYAKIFTTCPFGYQLDYLIERFYLVKNPYFLSLIPESNHIDYAAEWIYNILTCNLLKQNGKAVSLMPKALLNDQTNIIIRKTLIEQGLIQSVIDLPVKLFKNQNIDCVLIVFTKQPNSIIHMADAETIFSQNYGEFDLSEEDIEAVVHLSECDTSHSHSIKREDLKNYDLNPQTYLK